MNITRLKPCVSRATVRVLEQLLKKAREGSVTGFAFIAMTLRGFVADAVGEAHNDPGMAREMLAALDRKLAKRTGARP